MNDRRKNDKGNPKPPSRGRQLSAFALVRESQTVNAQLDVADVLQLRPDWSAAKAALFLKIHAEVLGTAMINSGATMLAMLIGEDRYAN